MKILHFTWHCINRFLYSHLVCCCIVNCDFQEFLCTVTCIKNLLLSNLNDKPQRPLTLNHIESNCDQPYNHLPDNGRPFVACVSILSIPVSSLNMRGLFLAELLATYSRARVSCISSWVKVPKIQRQGLDKADIVDRDLKPHLNMCALRYNPTISALETWTSI